ncbi:integrase, catalytic region, zinc finger, CCHC-type containing protein, partial [Tanacetum coccineum]
MYTYISSTLRRTIYSYQTTPYNHPQLQHPQLQQQFSPSQYGSIHPNQHYSSTYPSQLQFNHSSIPTSYPYQSQMNHQTSSVPQIAYQSPQVTTKLMIESPLVDSSFVVPVFSPGDDPITCFNKAIAFLTAVASLRFPSTDNQLKTSSNPRNQTTIQDSRVTVQQVQGRQGQIYSGTGYKSNATSFGGNNESGQARVVKCYNCQGEGHMARQCTQPKRPRNAAWYKDKAMLAEAQEVGQISNEEQLAFLADLGVPDGQAVQTIIPNNAAFQTVDLDTYDSDCDDISMQKRFSWPTFPTMVLTLSQRYKEPVKMFEQCLNIDLSSREKMIDSQMDDMIKEKLALKEQVDSLEQNLS